MPSCILCVLEVDNLVKCKECSLECCEGCITDWYTKNCNYSCPQCRRIKTFDVSIYPPSLPLPTFGLDTVLGSRHGSYDPPIDVVNHWHNLLRELEFAEVGDHHAAFESISTPAPNAPTFVATSLLPRPTIPDESFNFNTFLNEHYVNNVANTFLNEHYGPRPTIPDESFTSQQMAMGEDGAERFRLPHSSASLQPFYYVNVATTNTFLNEHYGPRSAIQEARDQVYEQTINNNIMYSDI